MDPALMCCLCNYEATSELDLDAHIDTSHADIFTAHDQGAVNQMVEENLLAFSQDSEPQPTATIETAASVVPPPTLNTAEAPNKKNKKKESKLPVNAKKTNNRKRLSLQGDEAGDQPKKRSKNQGRLSAPITLTVPEAKSGHQDENADHQVEGGVKKEIGKTSCEKPMLLQQSRSTTVNTHPMNSDISDIKSSTGDAVSDKIVEKRSIKTGEGEPEVGDEQNKSGDTKETSEKKKAKRRTKAEMEEYRKQLEIKKNLAKTEIGSEKNNGRKSGNHLPEPQVVNTETENSVAKVENEASPVAFPAITSDQTKKSRASQDLSKSKSRKIFVRKNGHPKKDSTSGVEKAEDVTCPKAQMENNQNNNDDDHRAQIDELKSQLEASNANISGLEDQLYALELANKETEKLLEKSTSTNEILKSANFKMQEQVLESEQKLRSVEIDNAETKKENERLLAEKSELQSHLSEFQSKVEYLVGKNTKLGGQISEYSKLQSEFDQIKSQIASLQSDSGKMQLLEDELEKANSERETLKNELVKLKEAEAGFKTKLINFALFQKKVCKEKSELREELNNANLKVDKFVSELERCTYEADRLQKENEAFKGERKQLNVEIMTSRKKSIYFETIHTKANQEVQKCKLEIDQLKELIKNYESDLENRKEAILNTTNDLCAIKDARQYLEQCFKSKVAEVNQLKMYQERSELKIKQLERELSQLKRSPDFIGSIKATLEKLFQQDSEFCEMQSSVEKLSTMSDSEIFDVAKSMLEDYIKNTDRHNAELSKMNRLATAININPRL